MSKELLMSGKAVNAELETTLAIESFLKDNFLFRRNVLNGKVEFAIKPSEDATNDDGKEQSFRPLTQEALNSIVRKAKTGQTLNIINMAF